MFSGIFRLLLLLLLLLTRASVSPDPRYTSCWEWAGISQKECGNKWFLKEKEVNSILDT